jgi:DNA-binding transcriptional MerR regulator
MATLKKSFSTREAARVSGVSHRTVDYWAKTKLLVPSIADANGTGTDRLYSFDDLVALRVVRELRQAGISTQALREVVKKLREKGWPKALSQLRLVGIGSQVCVVRFVRGCKQLEDALTGQELFAFMVDFEHAVQDVQDGIDGLAA